MKHQLLFILLFCFLPIFAKKASSWVGVASYYASKFNGRKTASGEIFRNDRLTCANNFLSFGTYLKVTNLKNKKWVIVKVNDRLHGANKRLLDLSQAAAKKIGSFKSGLAKVKVELSSKEEAGKQAAGVEPND